MSINISVIVPAYNAAATIGETLDSLLAQTSPHWEAIIIDDGSVDGTMTIVGSYIEKDKRIRVLSQPNQGVSIARNTGINNANFEWLLFLDADDWVSPYYVERATNLILQHPDVDAVHCGWVRIAPDGSRLKERYAPASSDLFPVLAKMCPFAVHACIVKRTMADKVGRFDPSVKNCQDWDFWQRVARTGAKFGVVNEVLALYRMQPNSLSSDRSQFYSDALRMLVQGHSPDPRVLDPCPDYVNGQSPKELSSLKLYLTSWFAGLLIGQEKDAQHLLKFCENDHDTKLDAFVIAENIFETVLISGNLPLTAWCKLWPKTDKYLSGFLAALELQSKSNGLAKSTQVFLEGMVLEHTQLDQPVKIGTTQGIRIEITQPIPDIYPLQNTERLLCMLQMEDNYLGKLELPVCDTMVSGWLIKDAIAAQFAWQILGRFFEYTVYPEIDKQQHHLQPGKDQPSENIHDLIGWKVFLQQLWAQPNSQHDSHKSKRVDTRAIRSFGNSDLSVIEISKKLPKIIILFKELRIELKLGGVSMGIINLPSKNFVLTSQALRKIINIEGNFELCRVCVREALIGKPLNGRTSLQERLSKAAAVINDSIENAKSVSTRYFPTTEFVTEKTVMLAYRYGIIGTSSSRRGMLPGKSIDQLKEMADSAGEQVLDTNIANNNPHHILYVPELITNVSINNKLSINQRSITAVKPPIRLVRVNQSQTLNKSSGITLELPILNYHHIAPKGALNINGNYVTTESFEDQLQYLRDNNYYSANWDDWINAMFKRTPLQQKIVAITFDAGYLDFYQYAWPLLRKYGFTATVFLTTNYIGRTKIWNKDVNGEVALMGWNEIVELQKEGIQFGSHSATYTPLTALSPEDIISEAAQSRTILQKKLKVPIRIFAYPHGHTDPVVAHLVGACGYTIGLTHKQGLCTFMDNTLNLPRLEIKPTFSLQDFIEILNINRQ